jgi:hypothetical protein
MTDQWMFLTAVLAMGIVVAAVSGYFVFQGEGVDFSGTFKFASDGNGGTDIFDPPAANLPDSSVEINPSNNDQFIFWPGLLGETTSRFDSHRDSIEFDQFSKVDSMQQTSAPITTDVHGDAFVDFWHEHSTTAAGWTAAQLHQFLQGTVHLHLSRE